VGLIILIVFPCKYTDLDKVRNEVSKAGGTPLLHMDSCIGKPEESWISPKPMEESCPFSITSENDEDCK